MKKLKLITVATIVMAASLVPLGSHAMGSPSGGVEGTFKAKCVVCHGADGSGNTAMGKKLNVRDLRSPEVQKQSDGAIANIITNGKDKMPQFGKSLSPEQVHELVGYVRGLAK